MATMTATIDELKRNIKPFPYDMQEVAEGETLIKWSIEEGAEPLLDAGEISEGFYELARMGVMFFIFEYPYDNMIIYKEIRRNGFFGKKSYVYSVWIDFGRNDVFSFCSTFESVKTALSFVVFSLKSKLDEINSSSDLSWDEWYYEYKNELLINNPALRIGSDNSTYVDLMERAPLKRAYSENLDPRELGKKHASILDAGDLALELVKSISKNEA